MFILGSDFSIFRAPPIADIEQYQSLPAPLLRKEGIKGWLKNDNFLIPRCQVWVKVRASGGADNGLPIPDTRLPIPDTRPRTTDYRPRTTDYRPQTTDHRPPTWDH